MRRLRRRYKRPKSPYDEQQIADGKELQKTYGLRRKKEIWIGQEIVRSFRQRARGLTAESNPAEEKILLQKLATLGLLPKDAHLDDVLGLTVESLLNRRLQTLVHTKELAKTPGQARQSIVHGHVSIGGQKMVFPSYLVRVEEEGSIASTFTPPTPLKPASARTSEQKPSEEEPAEESKEKKAEGGKEAQKQSE